MSLTNLLKHRNAIYGVLALWIILFHINRALNYPIHIPILGHLVESGNIGVDIFMFFSGCCLYLSMKRKSDIKEFYKRRVIRLIPSYLIISIPFWFWKSLIEAPRESGGFHFLRFFGDLLSATFWLTGVQTTWFVFAIFAFYIIFPLIFRIVNKGFHLSLALLSAVYLMNVLGILFSSLYEKSSIAWTRLPIFIIGVIAGRYIERFNFDRLKKAEKIILFVGVSGVLLLSLIILPLNTVIDGNRIPSEYIWLLYGPITICSIILLILCIGPCGKINNQASNALETIGGLSLELYMSHIIILHLFKYYNLTEVLGIWSFLVIIILAFVVSFGVQQIVIKRLTRKNMR